MDFTKISKIKLSIWSIIILFIIGLMSYLNDISYVTNIPVEKIQESINNKLPITTHGATIDTTNVTLENHIIKFVSTGIYKKRILMKDVEEKFSVIGQFDLTYKNNDTAFYLNNVKIDNIIANEKQIDLNAHPHIKNLAETSLNKILLGHPVYSIKVKDFKSYVASGSLDKVEIKKDVIEVTLKPIHFINHLLLSALIIVICLVFMSLFIVLFIKEPLAFFEILEMLTSSMSVIG